MPFDKLNDNLAELLTAVDSGALDHLEAAEKIAMWQKFETLRNKLPLIDHQMIADAEASDLPREYCSSTMIQFLVRVLQLSPGDAASGSVRPRPSGPVPRCSA